MALTEANRTTITGTPSANVVMRKLTTSQTLFSYNSGTFPNLLVNGRVFDVTGATYVLKGTNFIWPGEYLVDPDIWVIDPTLAVIFGQETGTLDPRMRTLTISGDAETITPNLPVATVESLAGSNGHLLAMVSPTLGLTWYNNGLTSSRLCRFAVSGTTITPEIPVDHTIPVGNHDPLGMGYLGDTRIALFYRQGDAFNNAMVQIIDIATGITRGVPVRIPGADVTTNQSRHCLVPINPTKFAIAWRDIAPATNEASVIIVECSGTAITNFGTKLVLHTDDNSGIAGLTLTNTSTLQVAYVQNASAQVEVQSLGISGLDLTPAGDTVLTLSEPSLLQFSFHEQVNTGESIMLTWDTQTSTALTLSTIGGAQSPGLSHSQGGIPGSII